MIPIQTLVKNKKTSKQGVTVNDSFNICGSWEALVVYEGTTYGLGTDEKDLEIVGPEDAAIRDPKKCGAGRGEKCCIFLVVGTDGFECQRFGQLRTSIQFRSGMVAKREPLMMFPDCQLP